MSTTPWRHIGGVDV